MHNVADDFVTPVFPLLSHYIRLMFNSTSIVAAQRVP
jgi:hypothetical protein